MLTFSDSISIRAATLDDARAIARFHVEVWRETYHEIAPPEALEKLDEERRLPHWRDVLAADRQRQDTLIATSPGGIVGLVSYGPPENEVFGDRGEVRHLYVGRDARGSGLGRRLMALAMDRLYEAGYPGVGLSVVKENARARRFYGALGGVEIAGFQDPGPLWRSSNLVVAWPRGAQPTPSAGFSRR